MTEKEFFEAKLKSFSNKQIFQLGQVLETIHQKIDGRDWMEFNSITGGALSSERWFMNNISNEKGIPYDHFPKTLEKFDINNLLNKLVKDFLVFYNLKTSSSYASFDFIGSGSRFYILKDIVDKRINKHPETERRANKNIENLKAEIAIGKLVAFDDGTIRYGDDILDLRNQLKDLCRFFMKNHKRQLTIDDIRDEIINADKRSSTPNSTIAKYVSELHNSLKIHLRKNVIFSQKEEGWYLKI